MYSLGYVAVLLLLVYYFILGLNYQIQVLGHQFLASLSNYLGQGGEAERDQFLWCSHCHRTFVMLMIDLSSMRAEKW